MSSPSDGAQCRGMSLISPSSDLHGAVSALRRRVVGDVLLPGHPGYADACAGWNLTYAHDPALIVVAADAADIVATMRFAHANGWPVTVQATGHGVSRPADDGVLIITSKLASVSVDPERRTATVACGAKWSAVLASAQQYGLAPLLGSSTNIGAVGYTLGGGMGWLGRQYGLASDSVVSFEVVLADGSVVCASNEDHPDLFWALRGVGAATFGVVIAMTIELYPVTTVYAGNLFYPVEMAADVIRRYRSWVTSIDHRLTSAVLVMNFPPFDDVPELLRGQSFVIVRGCWSGERLIGEQLGGEQLIDEWRSWRAPLIDLFGPMSIADVDLISNDPVDPMPAMVTSEWFDELSDAAIDVIVAATSPGVVGPPMLMFSELRHAGGAIRANAAGTANRRSRIGEFLLEMIGIVFSPDQGDALRGFLDMTRAQLAPFVSGAASINFLEGDEKFTRSASTAAADDLERLRDIKQAVDPGNRFCRTLHIDPTNGKTEQ